MGSVSIEEVALFVWALALLLGCVIAVRARRGWATISMVSGSVLGVVCMVGAVIANVMMNRTMVVPAPAHAPLSSGSPSMVSFDHDRWDTIMNVTGFGLLLGLVIFVMGFVGFCNLYGTEVRRTAELEELAQALQGRLAASEDSR